MNKEQKTAILGGAAIIVVASTIFLAAVSDSADDKGTDGKHTTKVAASTSPTASPSPSGPQQYGLEDTAKWDGVSLTMEDFRRGRTEKYGVPEKTDFVRFHITVTNDRKTPLDLDDMIVNCTTQQVYDFTDKLEGVPEVHVLPGDSLSWDLACALDKAVEEFQVEFNPEFGEYETAIFAGAVK